MRDCVMTSVVPFITTAAERESSRLTANSYQYCDASMRVYIIIYQASKKQANQPAL